MKIEHELIAAIYEAPLKPDGWPNVLTYFAEFANAGAATIALFDFNYSEYHLDLVSRITSQRLCFVRNTIGPACHLIKLHIKLWLASEKIILNRLRCIRDFPG